MRICLPFGHLCCGRCTHIPLYDLHIYPLKFYALRQVINIKQNEEASPEEKTAWITWFSQELSINNDVLPVREDMIIDNTYIDVTAYDTPC